MAFYIFQFVKEVCRVVQILLFTTTLTALVGRLSSLLVWGFHGTTRLNI